ncbi:MAG TPA: AsmA-like C-terminal region-containing protein, partial [Hyphomicrobiaceae bacterium]|nr:AsmA-like C-terminal region-containing protein [Hyphomicrobiaceae bacterium]
VANALRGLQQGRFTGLSASPSEKTDFSQLTASFDIVNGVATNQDLTMLSPLLRITGHGSVMLPDRTIDYTLSPKLVADLSGQGGNTGLAGLQIPIRIVGPWDRPDIAPDLSKIDAGQAVQAVQDIGKRLKGQNADEIVDDLFGKGTKENQKAKKFLDKLFR